MIIHALTLSVCGIVGFLVGGAWGAAALVVPWAAVLIACRRFQALNARTRPESAEQPLRSAYANIDEVTDQLDDLARERNWDLDKRFEIARMACENPAATFDQLERYYDRGGRASPDKTRPDGSREVTNDRPA